MIAKSNKFRARLRGAPIPGVYGLFDPREPNRVRYVGSSHDCAHRLYSHCGAQGRKAGGALGPWLSGLWKDGVEPGMRLLEMVSLEPGIGWLHKDPKRDLLEEKWVKAVQADLNYRLGLVGARSVSPGKHKGDELRALRARVLVLEQEVDHLKSVMGIA